MHKNLLLFCIALILCGFSYAEIKEIKGYSLGKCFLETVSRSESLAYEEEKVVQAEEQYSQALSLLFPKLGGSLSYSRSDASVTPAPDSTTFKLTASQSLFNGFRVLNAFKKSGLQLSNQKLAYDWAYSLLYTDLSQSFFLVLYLEKEKQLLEEQSLIFEKRLRELKERLRVGRSRSTEVLSFEISMALLKTQIVQLKMQTDTARNYFSFISGLDKSTKLIEKDKEVLPTLKSFAEYKKRIELRPDVLASKEAIRIASVAVEIAESTKWFPDIDLNGNYYLQRPSPYQNVAWDVQLLLTLPVFLNYNAQSKVKEMSSVQRQAEIAYAQLVKRAEDEVENTYKNLVAENEQIKMLVGAIELAEKNVNTIVQDYTFGLSNNLEVLQAMNSLIDLKRNLNKQRYAYKTDYERLQSLVNSVPIKLVNGEK